MTANGVAWDLDSYFPEFDGPGMRAMKEGVAADVAALRRDAAAAGPLTDETAGAWEALVLRAEDVSARLSHLFSYVGCLSAAHADDERYSRERARLSTLAADLDKFEVDLLNALREAGEETFARFTARPGLKGAEHSLRRDRRAAAHLMPREQEILATDLLVDGLHAWGRLYDTVTGKLTFPMRWPDGRVEEIGVARLRSLLANPDRAVGRAAFDGGNEAFGRIEDVCGAALNAIAGVRLTLNRNRGVPHFLDPALLAASIERSTLDAMMAAIDQEIETGRDLVRGRARAMGQTAIAWYEREAPLPLPGGGDVPWPEGRRMVGDAFRGVYPALADYYETALENRWIESQSRPAKRPGAFCTGSPLTKEQRVYMTWNGTLGDVATLAHEVGHAFHGHLLKDLRPLAKHYPMTLAETASLFGEAILAEGVLSSPDVPEEAKLLMLDGELSRSALTLLDITVRYQWEKRFHEERLTDEVPVSRMKELMVETQRRVFGDALEVGGEDPLFWVSKLHFYITGTTFYNFPYTFGMLLARALYLRLKEEGPSFLPRYEEFLRLTGQAPAEEVARLSIGSNLGDVEFWAAAIRSLRDPLTRYESLLAASRT